MSMQCKWKKVTEDSLVVIVLINAGELFMRVENFEGLSDNQLIEMFRQLRKEDYRGIEASIEEL